MPDNNQKTGNPFPGQLWLWIVWCRGKLGKVGPWAMERPFGAPHDFTAEQCPFLATIQQQLLLGPELAVIASNSVEFPGKCLEGSTQPCCRAVEAVVSVWVDIGTNYKHLCLTMFRDKPECSIIFGEDYFYDGEFEVTLQRMRKNGMPLVADLIPSIHPERRIFDLEDPKPNSFPVLDSKGHLTKKAIKHLVLENLWGAGMETAYQHLEIDRCADCDARWQAERFSRSEFEDLDGLHHYPKSLAPKPIATN